jgi:hypothetical protein
MANALRRFAGLPERTSRIGEGSRAEQITLPPGASVAAE